MARGPYTALEWGPFCPEFGTALMRFRKTHAPPNHRPDARGKLEDADATQGGAPLGGDMGEGPVTFAGRGWAGGISD